MIVPGKFVDISKLKAQEDLVSILAFFSAWLPTNCLMLIVSLQWILY